MKRSRDSAAPASAAIIVRVGGVDFRTSRETLKQADQGYFAALLSYSSLHEMDVGRGEVLPVVEVDRDSEMFRHVLAWMRTGRLPSAVVTNMNVLEDLASEADFFAFDGLTAAIQAALMPLRLSAEPLRALSLTTGCFMIGTSGRELNQFVTLAPHELCYISYASCITQQFRHPRKQHDVYCGFEERTVGSTDEWTAMFPRPATLPEPHVAYPGGVTPMVEVHAAGRVLLASFVYTQTSERIDVGHMDDDDVEWSESHNSPCRPMFSQRINVIVGPRGVHNPAHVPAVEPGVVKETRLVFGHCKLPGTNGATWSLFGFVGPADKVIECATRRA